MSNMTIAAALRHFDANKRIVDIDMFWASYGRPDLMGGVPLTMAPVLSSIEYEVRRRLAKRLDAAKPAETIELAGGATATVIRKDRTRPDPLTHFLHAGSNYGDGRARYYMRRPTKGWRWTTTDDAEERAWRKQGVPVLVDLPGRSEIRKRRVA